MLLKRKRHTDAIDVGRKLPRSLQYALVSNMDTIERSQRHDDSLVRISQMFDF